jgi:hypothetical protein
VPVEKALGVSVMFATVGYYLPIAFIPGFFIPGQFANPHTQNALVFFYDQHKVRFTSQVAAYSLAVVGIMPNIVAYSVAMRDNVQGLGGALASFKVSFVVTCIGPWLFAWLFYFGSSLNSVINWTAIGSNGVVNYIVPLLLVLRLAELQGAETEPETLDESNLPWSDRPLAGDLGAPRFSAAEVLQARILLVVACLVVLSGYGLALSMAVTSSSVAQGASALWTNIRLGVQSPGRQT